MMQAASCQCAGTNVFYGNSSQIICLRLEDTCETPATLQMRQHVHNSARDKRVDVLNKQPRIMSITIFIASVATTSLPGEAQQSEFK